VIRLILFALVAAAVIASLLHINIWIVLVPLGLFLAYAFTVGGLKTKCPACRKRIKLGATACHHCGRSTVATGK
jgi:hypothetical protein